MWYILILWHAVLSFPHCRSPTKGKIGAASCTKSSSKNSKHTKEEDPETPSRKCKRPQSNEKVSATPSKKHKQFKESSDGETPSRRHIFTEESKNSGSQSPLKLTKGSDGRSNETPPRKHKYSEESMSEGEESNPEILYSPQTPQNHEDSFKTPSGSHKNITAQKSEELFIMNRHQSTPREGR